MGSSWKVKVAPNPVAGSLLQISSNLTITGLRITDVNGKILLTQPFDLSTYVHYVNVSRFARGYYFIEIINNKNEVYHSKFIKN